MLDTKALRALAEAATPGPWVDNEGVGVIRADEDANADYCGICVTHDSEYIFNGNRADAAYIAAAHPGTVLALLDALDAMAWKLSDYRNGYHDPKPGTTYIHLKTWKPSDILREHGIEPPA